MQGLTELRNELGSDHELLPDACNTSPDIVDEACNFAWMEFMRYQPDRVMADHRRPSGGVAF